MRENCAAAARPRKPAFQDAGVMVEGGVTLYYLLSWDVYLPAEAFVRAAAECLRAYAINDRRVSRSPSERYLALDARRRLAIEELLRKTKAA